MLHYAQSVPTSAEIMDKVSGWRYPRRWSSQAKALVSTVPATVKQALIGVAGTYRIRGVTSDVTATCHCEKS